MICIKRVTYIVMIIALFVSCDNEFLNRTSPDEITADSYFKTESQLKTYTNNFYSIENVYSKIIAEFVDNAANFSPNDRVKGTRTVPSTGGGWGWGKLRDINFFLAHINQFNGPKNIQNNYEGVARFFRAWFYFKKVKRFGDVPWYSMVIDTDDSEALNKARDQRSVVMDSILVDINFAIQNLNQQKDIAEITKWTALALKSRIFLFAGTYRKYHGIDGYEEMLDESISASSELMNSGKYGIYTDGGNREEAYVNLFRSKDAISEEIILARIFDGSIPMYHGINFRTNSSSYGRSGVTKQLINSYLMTDGSRFTDIPDHNEMSFYEETRNRDPRLAQTIRTPGYTRQGEEQPSTPDFTATMTGYQYIKFIQSPSHFSSNNDNDLPIYRYAETLLNYAEAKAEKGTLTQSDLDKSIKLIRDRISMPNINMANANANPDLFLAEQYENVSGPNKGVILEIRRERRIELVREGFRWDDLMRWKNGDNVTRVYKGMYFSGPGEYDLDHNGTVDLVIYKDSKPSNEISEAQYRSLDQMYLENDENGGLMVINEDIPKIFVEPKDYLYPIPLQELQLNTNLTQNPGWSSQ